MKPSLLIGALLALSLAACARENEGARVPSLAFAAPVDIGSPCAAGAAPRVVGNAPSVASGFDFARDGSKLTVRYETTSGVKMNVPIADSAIDPSGQVHSGTSDRSLMLKRPAGSFLVVWIDGDAEAGYSVSALALSSAGAPMGKPFSLSDGKHAALGTLRGAFLDDDSAIVAYYSSSESAFEIVATPVVCVAP